MLSLWLRDAGFRRHRLWGSVGSSKLSETLPQSQPLLLLPRPLRPLSFLNPWAENPKNRALKHLPNTSPTSLSKGNGRPFPAHLHQHQFKDHLPTFFFIHHLQSPHQSSRQKQSPCPNQATQVAQTHRLQVPKNSKPLNNGSICFLP